MEQTPAAFWVQPSTVEKGHAHMMKNEIYKRRSNMHALALYGIAIGTLGMVATSNVDPSVYEATDSSSVVLVQGVSGDMSPSSANTGKGLDTGKSGTGKETDVGRGETGNRSLGTSDQPTSG